MAEIIIVDDDYASELLLDHLCYLGHNATRLSSLDEGLENIDQIAACDLLILDIIMAPSENAVNSSIRGGAASGMIIFQEVRKKNSELKILAYTAISDPDVVKLLINDPNTTYCSKWSPPTLSDLTSRIQNLLGLDQPRRAVTSFIVHGHDEEAKLAVKNYLQNNLRLSEPIILDEQPNLGRTIIEKFQHYAREVQLVLVILTPDDIGA